MTSKRVAQTNQQQKSEIPNANSILQRAAVGAVTDKEVESGRMSQSRFVHDFTQVPINRGSLPKEVSETPNQTGLPDELKAGVENLSGYSLNNVRVHYNSLKPAQLQALAYTKGTEIHVAPGQEEHLPHEAWHVVQQKQGRVQPMLQTKGVTINDDQGLEKEAEEMGAKALKTQEARRNRGKAKVPIIFSQVSETAGSRTSIGQVAQLVEEKDHKEVRAYFDYRIREIGSPTSKRNRQLLNKILTEAKSVEKAKKMIQEYIAQWHKQIMQEGEGEGADSSSGTVITGDPLERLAYQVSSAKRYLTEVRGIALQHTASTQHVLGSLTQSLEYFLTKMYEMAASSRGLEEYSLLAVGSMARQEMFPFSDLDYAVLVAGNKKNLDLVQEVEDYINLRLELMGEPKLDAFGQGTGTDVATEHTTTKRDVLMDARVMHTEGVAGAQQERDYMETRQTELGRKESRERVATDLLDSESTKFSVTSTYLKGKEKDAKKGLLRMPVFIVRNLCLYFNLKFDPLNVWGRVNTLVELRYLNKGLADQIIHAVEFATQLRLALHNYYGSENEEFALPTEDNPKVGIYVLSPEEMEQYQKIVPFLLDLETRAKKFAAAKAIKLEDLLEGANLIDTVSKDESESETKYILKDQRMVTVGVIHISPDANITTVQIMQEDRSVSFFVVDAVTRVLKDIRGKTMPSPSQQNPFAS